MRAGVAIGNALLDQGKPKEALAALDEVIANDADSDAAERQRVAARLAKARALVASKRPDEAVRLIGEIIKGADAGAANNPAQTRLLARAYTALGTAQRAAGRTTEALLSFLRVDQLYSAEAEAHAESLANLAELWTERHMIERTAAPGKRSGSGTNRAPGRRRSPRSSPRTFHRRKRKSRRRAKATKTKASVVGQHVGYASA